MEPNMNQMNSMTFVERLALRWRQFFHTLLRKMALLKERIEQSWKPSVPWSMIKVYQSSYGEKLPTLSYMFKIGAHIRHWISSHPKKFSLVRNLMFLILEYLGVHVFSCALREKKQVRSIWKERNICGL